jgi:hypothetical protein
MFMQNQVGVNINNCLLFISKNWEKTYKLMRISEKKNRPGFIKKEEQFLYDSFLFLIVIFRDNEYIFSVIINFWLARCVLKRILFKNKALYWAHGIGKQIKDEKI